MIEIYSDGGARPNPGEAGIGFAAYREGKRILSGYMFFPHLTNNQAEFVAAINALAFLRSNFKDVDDVVLHVDSKLVYGSTLCPGEHGYMKIKAPNLIEFREVFLEAIALFKKLTLKWIPREENTEADGLVKTALALKTTKILKLDE